ncbi:MAG: nitrilase [Clostridia bacterium]|nr:nitrilase [Clostridia bacterium]
MVETFVKRIFGRKICLSRIENHIARLPAVETSTEWDTVPSLVKISTVQRGIKLVKNIEDYIDIINSFIEEAYRQDSRLVVFPEYNFFDLFGFIPGFTLINRYLNDKGKSAKSNDQGAGDVSKLAPFFKGIAVSIGKGIDRIFSLLARRYAIYIYTGTFILPGEKGLYNVGFLYSPKGECIGSQRKLHLTDFEEQIGLMRGNTLKVYDLPIGRIAFPVCMDASYFETFYRAEELNAELVILPIANMEEYNLWKAIRGIWPRVQESYIYGAKSSLNGWIAGMHFTGKAGIFAPLSLSNKGDGAIALSPHYEGNQLITATVNYQRLKQQREKAEYFGDRNSDFEKDFVRRTYFIGG